MNRLIIVLFVCCFTIVGCGGLGAKKEIENKEEKKWVRPESEDYKKIVADYELVGKWEEDQSSSGFTTSVTEIFKKGDKYKGVSFYGDYRPAIHDLKKKGDKYIIQHKDNSEYYKIVDGVLQLWDTEYGNTNYIFEPIDW